MGESVVNLIQVFATTLFLGLIGTISGLWLLPVLGRNSRLRRSLWLMIGVGLGSQALAAAALFMFGIQDAYLLTAVFLLIGASVVGFLYYLPGTKETIHGAPRKLSVFNSLIRTRRFYFSQWKGLFSLAVAFSMFSFHSMQGFVTWTIGDTSDLPRYISSAEIWQRGDPPETPLTYVESAHQRRAEYEKPVVTGLLVFLAQFGLHVDKFMTPLVIVLFYLIVRGLIEAVSVFFPSGPYLTALGVGTVMVATPQMTLFQFAQFGQLTAAAFLSLALAIVSHSVSSLSPNRASIPLGISLAAAIGSNVTLVIGSGLGLLGILLMVSSISRFRNVGPRLILQTLVTVVVLSAPMVSALSKSVTRQVSGSSGGGPWALPAPTAFLGTEPFPFSFNSLLSLVLWALLIGVLLSYLLFGVSDRGARTRAGLGLLLWSANFVIAGVVVGWDNYATFKFLALTVPFWFALFLPQLLAKLRIRRTLLYPLVFLTFISSALTSIWSVERTYFSPVELAEVRYLKIHQHDLNVAVPYRDQGLILGSIISRPSINVTEWAGYVRYSYSKFQDPPNRGPFLVPAEVGNSEAWQFVSELNSEYVIAEPRLEIYRDEEVNFVTDEGSRRFLFGRWGPTEIGGVPPMGSKTWLVFDFADSNREIFNVGQYVRIRFRGDVPSAVELVSGGKEFVETRRSGPTEWTVNFLPSYFRENPGRAVLDLSSNSTDWKLKSLSWLGPSENLGISE